MLRSAEVGSTANSYQILAKLATGGMAEIFLARGASVAGVERYVVLKRILPDRASDVHFVKMFLDEARLAAQLQHPNIAQVFDIGKLGDSYFFTMEYVHGETVRSLLSRGYGLRRQLPLNCVLSIAAQTASGIHHAHDRIGIDGRPLGIVHRDVSPSNLIASFEGHLKVVDFGVAKATERMQETRAGTVKGKISYLSPEQCRGGPIDRRSDLFALGIVTWEMLTGERLYRRESDFENMTAIVTEQPPPPSSVRPDLPPLVDQLVLRLLEKDPARRYQRGDELVEAIEDVAMRTQVTLSTTALARMLREMFGQRPEPWQELRALEKHPGAITVTSEPVPAEIIAAKSDSVRGALASVIDLEMHRAQGGESFPVVQSALSHSASAASNQQFPALPPSGPQSLSRPSTANLLAPARRSTGNMSSLATGTGDLALSATIPEADKSRPMWPIFAAILVAAALGAGAVWFAMRSSANRAPADASLVVIDPVRDASPSLRLDLDAGPELLTGDAERTNGNTPPAEDAYVPAPTLTIDAPGAPPDAAIAVDEFGACSDGAMTRDRATSCTLVACKRKLAATARTWFAVAPVKDHAMLVGKCRANDVILEPKRTTPPPPPPPPRRDAGVDCSVDPLACQH